MQIAVEVTFLSIFSFVLNAVETDQLLGVEFATIRMRISSSLYSFSVAYRIRSISAVFLFRGKIMRQKRMSQ